MRILYPVRSPCFIYCHSPCKNRHKRCLFHRYVRQRAFITKSRTLMLFTNTTLNLWGNSYRAYSFPKQWNGGHVVPKQSCASWTLFLCTNFRWFVTYSENRNLGQRSEATHFLLWFIQQKTALVLVEENRILTACSQTTVFIYICMFKSAKTDCRVFKCH